MSLHDRLSRIKQTHGIVLSESSSLDIRSSNDVVPFQHGSFINRTTRSASRANSRHQEIMRKLMWLTEAPPQQIEPLSDSTNIPQLALLNGDADEASADGEAASPSAQCSPSASSAARELRHSSSGTGKRVRRESSGEGAPSRKRAAVAAAAAPEERSGGSRSPSLRRSRRGSDVGRTAVVESREVVEARDKPSKELPRRESSSSRSSSRSRDSPSRSRYSSSSSRSSRSRSSSERSRGSMPRSSRLEPRYRQSPSPRPRSSCRSSAPRSTRTEADARTSPSASPLATETAAMRELRASGDNPSDAFLKLARKHEMQFEGKKKEGTGTKRSADSCTSQKQRALYYLKAGLQYLESIAVLEEAVIAYRAVASEKYNKQARSKKNELSQKILGLYSTTAKFFGDCAGLILKPLKARHTKALATALNNTASLCYLCQAVSLMRRVYSLRHRMASTRVDWLKSLQGSGNEPAKKEQVNFLTDAGDALLSMDAWEQARKLRTIGDLPPFTPFVSAPSVADIIEHVKRDEGYSS